MQRYFITLGYKGTKFHGWQIQPNAPSIQETLNNAIGLLLNEPVHCVGCGRTDTGVHAKRYYVHFDTQKSLPDGFVQRLNKILTFDIVIYEVQPVAGDFHSRFSALSRTYKYFLNSYKDPFKLGLSTYLPYQLEVDVMNEAASCLPKFVDQKAFSKIGKPNEHYLCNIYSAFVEQPAKDEFIFTISANRFVRGQVRLTVGTLIDVGRGRITPTQFEEIVASQSRKKASAAAPAEGLYLWDVEYGGVPVI